MNGLRSGSIVALLVAGNFLHAQSSRTSTPAWTPRVVFVCEHGTVKSLVALEFFNRYASAHSLRAEAVSRGTHPDSAVPRAVSAGLLTDGFDVSAFHARLFTRGDVASSILVVALDASVDSLVDRAVPVIHWDGLPSVTADYPAARNAIAARVKHLVDSLASAKRKR
jgi:protein-tyrosine-phosphatase